MCQWMLQHSGEETARCAVLPVTVAEENSKTEAEKQKLFLHIMHNLIGTSQTPAGIGSPSNIKKKYEPYEDDEKIYEPDPKSEVTAENSK